MPFARSPGRSSCLPTVSCAQAAGAVRAAHPEVIMVSGVSRLYAHAGDAQTRTAAGSPHLSTVRALIMPSPWAVEASSHCAFPPPSPPSHLGCGGPPCLSFGLPMQPTHRDCARRPPQCIVTLSSATMLPPFHSPQTVQSPGGPTTTAYSCQPEVPQPEARSSFSNTKGDLCLAHPDHWQPLSGAGYAGR